MQGPQSDSDEFAWNIYQKFYGDQLDIQNKHLTFTHIDSEIDVAGDVCFNVKLKLNKRYTLLGSVIKEEPDFNKIKSLLEQLLYSPMNISLLPKTGGLNNIKGQFTCDRFDSFIWLLDAYYNGLRAPILNRGTKNSYIGNQKKLDNFLTAIKCVENFCKLFYGITDSNYIKELISSGKKTITEPCDYYKYLQKAIFFWKSRLAVYKGKNILTDEEINVYTNLLDELSKTVKKAMNTNIKN